VPPSSVSRAPAVQRRRLEGPQRLPLKDAGDDVWAILEAAGLWQEIGFLMRLAQLVFLEYAVPKLRRFNLSPGTMTILQVIRAQPGLTQQRIADTLRIKKANLTPVIQDLVGQGLIARKNSGSGKRAYALFLTAKGTRAFQGAKEALFGASYGCADNLTQNERQTLTRLLQKIVRRPGAA
jgi:DNA-binding MarR family transcriptional regulator